MANIDTGLGWYADSAWLRYTPGTIGVLTQSGSSGDFFELPKTQNEAATLMEFLGGGWTKYWAPLNASGDAVYCALAAPRGGVRYLGQLYICKTPSVFVYENRTGAPPIVVDVNTPRPGGQYYYSFGTASDGPINYNSPPLHVFDSEAELWAAADSFIEGGGGGGGTETTFAKAGAGFSVTCMCKWKTAYDGPVYVSPVLISSVENYTTYTRNSATPGVGTTQHSFQGQTFYMRKAPLDEYTAGSSIDSTYPSVDLSGVAQTNDTIFIAIAYQSGLSVGEMDPYSGAGESEPGAEEATFDFDSTAIDFGTPPTVTAAGMVELYIPSTSNLASLAQYLWAGSFDPDNFKKLFADPMDAIIGLQIVPVTATEIGTTPDILYVGNISTGLSMPKASRQYVPVDCGSLTIPRRLGSYLDYSPHTEMQLYLPYIGFVDISPDDCMGGTVSVKYMVDIIGGTCVAQVKCNNHVLYEYAAACSCQVPVSAGQYQNIVLGAARGGVALVSGILGAAGGGLFSGLSEAADAAMSMTKPKIQRSGGFGGSSGLMGHQTPYIIYTVPRLIVPGRQNNFIGYPSYITRTLGDLTGYTQIDSIHLTGIPASQSEQAEIEQLLQEGVYL